MDLVQGLLGRGENREGNRDEAKLDPERLTVVASVLLVPTLIVGLYGQNFDNMPELHWGWGYYGWSLGLIVVTTIAQIVFFRWRKWI